MKSKRILVICPRYPFPVRGGDKLRISEIIKFLSKKNSVDLISIGKNIKKNEFIRRQIIFKNNLINQTFQIIKSIFKKEPIQIGFYKIPKMRDEINDISKNYDVIIFHLIRTCYYFPKDFKGKKVLEMTDLISKNYETVIKNLSNFNLLKYLYKYEKIKLSKYELKQSYKFEKIVFVNNNDLQNSKLRNMKNTTVIGNGTHIKKNIYFENKEKKNIIFFGNINSLANRSACIDFIRSYLPKIKSKYPNLNFRVIGNCTLMIRVFFKLNGVEVFSNVKELKNYSKETLAGICNVKIQSGLQNKILDYTSLGIPILINKISNNFKFLPKKYTLVHKNISEFILNLEKLLKNKKLTYKISKENFKKTNKYYNWNKVLKPYLKIIK